MNSLMEALMSGIDGSLTWICHVDQRWKGTVQRHVTDIPKKLVLLKSTSWAKDTHTPCHSTASAHLWGGTGTLCHFCGDEGSRQSTSSCNRWWKGDRSSIRCQPPNSKTLAFSDEPWCPWVPWVPWDDFAATDSSQFPGRQPLYFFLPVLKKLFCKAL